MKDIRAICTFFGLLTNFSQQNLFALANEKSDPDPRVEIMTDLGRSGTLTGSQVDG